MAIRNIIRIDESKCNGCGNCITGCAEGALALVDGKAKLVKESYCDGLGACIGECPTGALTIERREADDFGEAAATAHAKGEPAVPGEARAGGGCPGAASQVFGKAAAAGRPSALSHWPVQLHLIDPGAEQYLGADLLIAADCTAFAHGAFHEELLAGRALVIACPKLDAMDGYAEKLAALFAQAKPRSVTIARMQVPCCGGLTHLVQQARALAHSDIPINEITIGIEGGILAEKVCQ